MIKYPVMGESRGDLPKKVDFLQALRRADDSEFRYKPPALYRLPGLWKGAIMGRYALQRKGETGWTCVQGISCK